VSSGVTSVGVVSTVAVERRREFALRLALRLNLVVNPAEGVLELPD